MTAWGSGADRPNGLHGRKPAAPAVCCVSSAGEFKPESYLSATADDIRLRVSYSGRMPLSPTLQRLQDESIHIFRATVAECRAEVLLYSIGKDSSVLLDLAIKAFAPSPLPFPLLHIDTGWKFPEMIAFRDATVARLV